MSTHKTALSGDIQVGEYIVIAETNYLNAGFYIGRGKTGSFQFFSVESLTHWLDAKSNPGSWLSKRKHPYKSYINSPYITRIAKYSPDCLSPEEKQEYEKAIEALKLLNLR